ncbi:hypothetical protein jhhlp_002620 [Lomentospora prolificans]|uniref:CRAL-TRIO domain-containing protein n=1 Tax=Lomentospora prolificans TaxID=41688 RepID=A0A2N3NEK5_9PEZI|nr:hypothetical protein jhhlp_002620 [Lomentospora prolificans]
MWIHAHLTRRFPSPHRITGQAARAISFCPPTFNANGRRRAPLTAQATGFLVSLTRFRRPAGRSQSTSPRTQPFRLIRLSGSSFPQVGVLLLITSILALASLTFTSITQRDADYISLSDTATSPEILKTMAAGDILPGRPGNLTPDQEKSLRKLWSSVLRICHGYDVEPTSLLPSSQASGSSSLQAEKPKKKRGSLFSRRANTPQTAETATSNPVEAISFGGIEADDKYGQNKQFLETLARQSPESIRETLWSMVKHDNPDALLLRFLRARKWDVEKALIMLISTMNWRATEMHVDDDIMKNGEGAAAEAEKSGDEAAKALGHDFLAQMRMGKSFLHGSDKAGRPICFVRVRLHRQGEHSEAALERNTVYIIETARMLLRPPVDTATIVFDMTGFSMANMDYTPVKFMIKCFEANYPESLGAVLVYKAPWVFQENALMADNATRDRLLEARWGLVEDYEQLTLDWVRSAGEEDTNYKKARAAIAEKLRENYWDLDPYLRARSLYDRLGMIKPGGIIDFYSTKPTQSTTAAMIETSPDDVD